MTDFGGEVYETPQCVHCGAPVSDYYMVRQSLWDLATIQGRERNGHMHWECLKTRLVQLGHKLKPECLTDAPINEWFRKEHGW